jgi:hypothetical protein
MLKAAAIASGALASPSLAASATAAALTSERGRDENQAKSLHRFLFSAGGPVHGGGLSPRSREARISSQFRRTQDAVLHHPRW